MNERELIDLTRLAVERSCNGLEGVLQLVEEDGKRFGMVVAVAASIIDGAATMVANGMKQHRGEEISHEAAVGWVLKHICEALEVDLIRYADQVKP